jgi:biotin operon repressor
MAAAIRIKLGDLLSLLMETPHAAHEPRVRQTKLFTTTPESRPLNLEMEKDLAAIKAYLLNGPARRSDLEMELNMSNSAVLHRLHQLKARGAVVDLPGHQYKLVEADTQTVLHKSVHPVKIILQRIQHEKYYWEVHVAGANVSEILPIIREANKKLKSEYGRA